MNSQHIAMVSLAFFLLSGTACSAKSAEAAGPGTLARAQSGTQSAGSNAASSSNRRGSSSKVTSAAAPIQGWELTLQSSYRGRVKMLICPLGTRMTSQDLACLMEPGKKVGYLTHLRNKRYLEMDPSKGLKGLGHMSYFVGPEKVTKVGEETISNLKTTHYFIEKYKVYNAPGQKQIVSKTPYWMTDLWVCNDLGISKEFAGDCARICMMPAEYGLPVKVVRAYHSVVRKQPQSAQDKAALRQKWGYCMTNEKFEGSQPRVLLELVSAQKRKDIDPNLAKLQPGYTKVKTEVELVIDKDEKKMLDELD